MAPSTGAGLLEAVDEVMGEVVRVGLFEDVVEVTREETLLETAVVSTLPRSFAGLRVLLSDCCRFTDSRNLSSWTGCFFGSFCFRGLKDARRSIACGEACEEVEVRMGTVMESDSASISTSTGSVSSFAIEDCLAEGASALRRCFWFG